VQLLTETGTLVATYYYDAFGVIVEEDGDSETNPYRYAGYFYDSETTLYYLKARFYDAGIARFMQEDTYYGQQGDPLSLNLYTYCRSNPITRWDPTGHWDVDDSKYDFDTQMRLIMLSIAYYEFGAGSKGFSDMVKKIRKSGGTYANVSNNKDYQTLGDFRSNFLATYIKNVNLTTGKLESLNYNQFKTVLKNSNITLSRADGSGDYFIIKLTFVDSGSVFDMKISKSSSDVRSYNYKEGNVKINTTPSSKETTPSTTPPKPLIDNNGLNFIANLEVDYLAGYMNYEGSILTSIDRHDGGTDLGYGYDYGTYGDRYKEILGGTASGGTTLTAEEALLLLQWEIEECAQAIINEFGDIFTQNQLNALVSLRFNLGKLSNIPGFIDVLKRGNYNRTEFETTIKGYYQGLVNRNENNRKYLDGWLKRTDRMLNLFFDNNYAFMGLDAVNGRKFA